MNSKANVMAISTVGYMCLAIAGWMISMGNAAWFSRQYSTAMLYPLAIVLGVMGILSFVVNRGLDAVVFFGGTALLGSVAISITALTRVGFTTPASFIGWFSFLWAAFFCCVWAGSFRSGLMRSSFLLGLWLSLLSLAVGGWTGAHGWLIAGGYLGLIASILAFGTSGTEIIRMGRTVNPNMDMPSAARPMAAD